MYRPAGYDSDIESEDDYFGDDFGKRNNNNIFQKEEESKDQISIARNLILIAINEDDLKKFESNYDIIRLSVDDPFDSQGRNLLILACMQASIKIVKYLIVTRGASVNIDYDGDTPLHIVCNSKNDTTKVLELIKYFMSEGTKINYKNLMGMTALMMASFNGHYSCVELLIKVNASINEIDNTGCNALFHAIEGNHPMIVKLLIDSGIEIDILNKRGFSPKCVARQNGYESIIELFPKEVEKYAAPLEYLMYNSITDLVPSLSKENSVPEYFPDVQEMLDGMNLEMNINKLAEAKVTLTKFLNITDKELDNFGIKMPYEQKMILLNLHKFHLSEWSLKSLPIFKSTDLLTGIQIYHIFATLMRQMIVLRAHIKYIIKISQCLPNNKKRALYEHASSSDNLKMLQQNINEVKKLITYTMIQKRRTNPLIIKENYSITSKIKVLSKLLLIPTIIFGCMKLKTILWKY